MFFTHTFVKYLNRLLKNVSVLFSVLLIGCVFVFFVIELFSVDSSSFYLFSSSVGGWLSALSGNSSQIMLDKTSVLFILVVLFICFLTQIYSISYMYSDRRIVVFQLFISIFALSMCLLVMSNSFTLFFLAWELIGISSFILIGFLNERFYAVSAALKAVYVNRFPDMCLFSAFVLLFLATGASDFESATAIVKEFGINAVLFVIVFILILIASWGKSAQFGFTGWLVSAMEGPTPVSALMHAATLVTAGTVLLIKCYGLFYNLGFWIFLIGFISSLYAGIAAIVESDFKSIVAYSTSSQIGFSFILVGLGEIKQAYFYITIHAIFKSLLFWSAGLAGHAYRTQYASSLVSKNVLFIANTGLILACWSLFGFPFVSGFYSKEGVLSLSAINFQSVLLFTFLITQIISIIYTVRLLLLLSDKLSSTATPARVKLTLTGVLALFPVLSSSVLSIFFALNLLTISRALTIETVFSSYSETNAVGVWFANFIGGWFVVCVIGIFIFLGRVQVLRVVVKKVVYELYIVVSVIFISCLLTTLLLIFVVIEFMPFVYLCFFSVLPLIRGFATHSLPKIVKKISYELHKTVVIILFSCFMVILLPIIIVIEFMPFVYLCFFSVLSWFKKFF